MIQMALIFPDSTASNSSTAFNPCLVAMFGACQKRLTKSISFEFSKCKCAASCVDKPPTSRPPIALGCPVIEKAPAPSLPIFPVAK